MKAFFHNLGCKVNAYETSAVRELFERHGFTVSGDDPDVVVVNTCAVTSTASQKSRQLLRKYRRMAPRAVLVAMGCHAQKVAENLIRKCGVDVVVGTSRRSEIYDLYQKFLRDGGPIVAVDPDPRRFSYESFPFPFLPFSTRAFIKIQDGCDNFCSYCVIPYTRGRSRSRPEEEILAEIARLIEDGFKEFILTGINAASYGKDLGNLTLSDLIEDIVRLPGLYRLRVSSLEESAIDERFVGLLRDHPAIADHLHVPLQSGSDRILRLMNRRYDVETFKRKIAMVREVRPDIAITTDVIVGFPGETDEDFALTLKVIREIGFAALHVFPYSRRLPARSAFLPGEVDATVKKERAEILLRLAKELHEAYARKFLGRPVEVVLEEPGTKDGQLGGFTSNYLRVSAPKGVGKAGEVYKTTYAVIE